MTREQQYWEDTQEALSRVFDRCEEIDPQSGCDMLEDIQFIRGFINKHKPGTEKQESILDRLKADIENEIRFWQEPSKYGNADKHVRIAKVCSYKHMLELINNLLSEQSKG